MSDVSYQPKYDAGDDIMLDGQYTTILDVEDGEYELVRKGRIRWVDASDIDAVAEPRVQQQASG